MLENDLILSRFLDAAADSLTEDDVANLDRLLHMADDELWQILSGRAAVPDARLAPFVARVRAG